MSTPQHKVERPRMAWPDNGNHLSANFLCLQYWKFRGLGPYEVRSPSLLGEATKSPNSGVCIRMRPGGPNYPILILLLGKGKWRTKKDMKHDLSSLHSRKKIFLNTITVLYRVVSIPKIQECIEYR